MPFVFLGQFSYFYFIIVFGGGERTRSESIPGALEHTVKKGTSSTVVIVIISWGPSYVPIHWTIGLKVYLVLTRGNHAQGRTKKVWYLLISFEISFLQKTDPGGGRETT